MTQTGRSDSLRIAYADPPYPGMSRIYKDHPEAPEAVWLSPTIETGPRDLFGEMVA